MVVCGVFAGRLAGSLHDGGRWRWRPIVRRAFPVARRPACNPGDGIAKATVPAGAAFSACAEPQNLLALRIGNFFLVVVVAPVDMWARRGVACPHVHRRSLAVAGVQAAAGRASGQWNASPATIMRCRIAASRRASATHAFLWPVCFLTRRAQSFSGCARRTRVSRQLAHS